MKTLLLLLTLGLSLAGRPAAGQAAPPATPRPPAPPVADELIIANVNVIDLDWEEVVPGRMVVLRNGAIISVGKWVPAGRGVPRLDGRGLYLVPGLWDGRTRALATAATARVALPQYLASGITSLRELPSARPLAEVVATTQALESGELAGPRLELAGPLLDGPPAGPLARRATRAQAQALTAALLLEDSWRHLLAGPTLPREAYLGVAVAADEARVPLGGAVPETVTLAEALAAGQVGIEGLDKLLLACSPREAALVAARTACLGGPWPAARLAACVRAQQRVIVATFSPARCAALAQALAQAHAYVVPALAAHAAEAAGPAAAALPDSLLRLVPAALRQQWAEAASARCRPAAAPALAAPLDSLRRRLLAELQLHHVRLVAGSDAGAATPGLVYGPSLLTELEALVAAGLTPAQALRAATVAPAIASGHGYDRGRIEPGYLADVVLLGANPLTDIRHLRRVVAVVVRGRLLDRAALAALAAEAAQAAGPAPALPPTPPTAAVRK